MIVVKRNMNEETDELAELLHTTRNDLALWDAAAQRSAEEARNLVISQPGLAVAILTAATSDWDVCTNLSQVRDACGELAFPSSLPQRRRQR